MKKQIQNALVCLLFVASFGLYAQQTVSGVVTDESGNPLPSVNVVAKGTSTGVSTDFDGNYTISVANGSVLVFSSIGFETLELTVAGATLNATLSESASELDEVVVIGYGQVAKKDLTGAVNLLNSDDFSDASVVSPQQLIQGKIAGVSVTTAGGAPGDTPNINIRGIGSLQLSSQPLYVVDGVPLDGGGIGGSRNVLNIINPNDIASMSILKDASATAIYGSRAANGVVLITTKKGLSKSGVQVNLSSRSTIYKPTDFVDVLSGDEFRAAIRANGTAADIALLGQHNTDWQSQIYQIALSTDNNVSVSAGVLNTPIRVSLGKTTQEGILKRDYFDRMTASLNFRPSFLDNDLRLDITGRFQDTNNEFGKRDAIGQAIQFDPTKPVYDNASPYDGYYIWLKNGRKLTHSPNNPLATINLNDDNSDVKRYIFSTKADYDIPFVENLTATVNVGYDYAKGEGLTATSKRIPTDEVGFNGSGSNYANETKNKLFDAYVNYKKDGDLSLDVTAGYSYQSFEYDNTSTSFKEILNSDGTVNTTASTNNTEIDKSKNVLLSYFGRTNLSYDNRYLLTATLRADASSKLNPKDRWGYFPSVALAWNLHNEAFFNVDFIDQIKLRLGYGEIGNVNGLGDYLFLTRYGRSDQFAQYAFGSNFYNTYRPEAINKNLRWEVGNTLNGGLDFALFNNRLSGSVNAYIKKNLDMIALSIVDPFTNFASTINANIGDMENKGIEVELNALLVDTDDFVLSISANASFNDNEITHLVNDQEVGGISGGVGNKIQRHEVGKAPFSFYVLKQVYDADGKPIEGSFADLNNDGKITLDDRYFYKNPYADILMGTTLNLRYKDFDISATGRGSFGNYVYNNNAAKASFRNAAQAGDMSRLDNVHGSFLHNNFQVNDVNNLLSDHFVENASFFRLDNITIGYSFENSILRVPGRVYVSADNVTTITNYSGIDPEIYGGIDNSYYPRSAVYAIGFDLKF